jgi:hypothetical protein
LEVRIKARRIIAAGRINRAKMVENMSNLLILLWQIKYHRAWQAGNNLLPDELDIFNKSCDFTARVKLAAGQFSLA